MFPLGIDGGDADAITLGPPIESTQDLLFGNGWIIGEGIFPHLIPTAPPALFMLHQLVAILHFFP